MNTCVRLLIGWVKMIELRKYPIWHFWLWTALSIFPISGKKNRTLKCSKTETWTIENQTVNVNVPIFKRQLCSHKTISFIYILNPYILNIKNISSSPTSVKSQMLTSLDIYCVFFFNTSSVCLKSRTDIFMKLPPFIFL